MNWWPAIFGVLFVGVLAFTIIATRRYQKEWSNRPAVLRALASRRGFQVVDNPGDPDQLMTVRTVRNPGQTTKIECPVAVRGRTLDTQLTLFDVFQMTRTGFGNNATLLPSYDTYITFRTPDVQWPHFEFASIAHVKADSLTGSLLAMTASAAEGLVAQRGLKHVPIPEQPGCQLYVGEGTENPAAARDALMKLFAQRDGWWVGAKGDTLAIMKTAQKSQAMHHFVPGKDIDRFIDDAIEMERDLRRIATRP